MEWMPSFQFGWLNGWLPLALLGITDGLAFLTFPKPVVARLLDRSGWSQRQVLLTVLGKLCALGCILMLIFSPLKLGSYVFWIGTLVVMLGVIGLAQALLDFRFTPPGEPVTQGLYSVSRHPQIVMASMVILGGCITIGSWVAVLLLLMARILGHFSILAEEAVCLRQYGASYRAYMQAVPRYFLFF